MSLSMTASASAPMAWVRATSWSGSVSATPLLNRLPRVLLPVILLSAQAGVPEVPVRMPSTDSVRLTMERSDCFWVGCWVKVGLPYSSTYTLMGEEMA